jgi:hypothetical protein
MVAPQTQTQPQVKTQPMVAPQTKTQTQTQTKPLPVNTPKTNTKTAPKRPGLPFIFGSTPDEVNFGPDAPPFPVKTSVGYAHARTTTNPVHLGTLPVKQILKKSMKEETKMENGEERKKIEYVARGKLDPKKTLGRLSAIKTRIIDEAEEIQPSRAKKIKSIVLDKKEEKLGINPAVETEPRLKPLHMAEGQVYDAIEKGSNWVANSPPARALGWIGRKAALPLTLYQTGKDYVSRREKGQDLGTAATGAGSELAGGLGGWAGGAALGGTAGAAIGGPFAPITAPVGAVVGGIAGSELGSKIAGWAHDKIRGVKDEDEKPSSTTPPKTTPSTPAPSSDSPAAVANPSNTNKSMFDPTPIHKQGPK